MSTMADLIVDPDRLVEFADASGFYVRATCDGRWGTYDMAQLDRASFLVFVGRGEVLPTWTRSILLGLFGYPRDDAEASL